MSVRIVKRFITFEQREPNNPRITTQVWEVINNRSGDSLGELSYYTGWRQYVFSPEPFTAFNSTCLREIMEQLERLNVEQRANKAGGLTATPAP